MSEHRGPAPREPNGLAPANSGRPQPGEEPGFQHPAVFYETRDAYTWLVLGTLIGLLVTILVCEAVIWKLYGRWAKEEYGGEPAPSLMRQYMSKMMPAPPRLAQSPGNPASAEQEQRQRYEQANQRLNSYGWVNQQAGVARIPINEAMKLFAQQQAGAQKPPPK